MSDKPKILRPIQFQQASPPPHIKPMHPATNGQLEVRVYIRTPEDCTMAAEYFIGMAERFRAMLGPAGL